MKKALLGSMAMLLMLSMTACSLFSLTEPKNFTCFDMTITLDNSFEDYVSEEGDASFVSDKHGYGVSITKKDFYLFEDENIPIPSSIEDFVAYENPHADITTETSDGVTYYIQEREVEGRDFTYLVALYESTDAYWKVSFVCESHKFDKAKPHFLAFAQTVMFEATDTVSLT